MSKVISKMRDRGNVPVKRHYNITLHQGGLGDLIAHLPAVKYILDHFPEHFYNLWVHDSGLKLVQECFSTYTNVQILGFSDSDKFYQQGLPARSPYAHKVSNLSTHMVDHAFYTVVHRTVENKHKNYIQLDPIDLSEHKFPLNYVVVTTGFTSKAREWKAESINAVCEYLISKKHCPVFLGRTHMKSNEKVGVSSDFNADYSKGINLINATTMLEAHSIMANAKAVVGLDNGLLHLAAMSEVPIIGGFTTVDPLHRLPYRRDELGWNYKVVYPTKEELSCIGCQSNMNFVEPAHNFTQCYFGDFKCLDLLPAERWIEKLQELGI